MRLVESERTLCTLKDLPHLLEKVVWVDWLLECPVALVDKQD